RGVGQTVASSLACEAMPRKVRAPQGTVPGNAWAARADGKCNREQTADGPAPARVKGSGKGETVREERTASLATGRHGKPHREQDHIGRRCRGPRCLRVGRLSTAE